MPGEIIATVVIIFWNVAMCQIIILTDDSKAQALEHRWVFRCWRGL